MSALIWVDWVIIAIIGVSTLFSLKRGFVREAISLAFWIGAFVIARTFNPNMQALLAGTIETPMVRMVVAFAILFFGTLLVGALVVHFMVQLVRVTGLTATDRVLGMIFGLARGVVLIVVALALLRFTPVTEDTWWQESLLVGEFGKVETWSRDVFGDDIERFLALQGEEGEERPGLEAIEEEWRRQGGEVIRGQIARPENDE